MLLSNRSARDGTRLLPSRGLSQLRQLLRSKQNEGNQENDDHFLHANWSHTCPPSLLMIAKAPQGSGASALGERPAPSPADGPSFRAWSADSPRSIPIGSTMHGTRSATRTPTLLQRLDLFRIVGHQPHRPHARKVEDRRRHLVAAQIRLEPQLLVGLHRVGALILQLVGAQLVQQADAAALLVLVNQQPAAFVARWSRAPAPVAPGNRSAGCGKRRRSGTANGSAPADRLGRRDIAHLQHHGFFRLVAVHALEPVDAEVAEAAGKIGFGDLAELKCGWHGTKGDSLHYNDRQSPRPRMLATAPGDPAGEAGRGRVAGEHPHALRRASSEC